MSTYLFLTLLVAVAATNIWRVAAFSVGSSLASRPCAVAAVEGVALAMLAGIVSRAVVHAGGDLAAVPLVFRVAAMTAAIAAWALSRSLAAGVVAGLVALVAVAMMI